MINRSHCVGGGNLTGEVWLSHTHTHTYYFTFDLCTVFIRLGEKKETPKSTRCKMCLYQLALTFVTFVSTHLMIERLESHPTFPAAVAWEGYWLTEMCKNRGTSLMIGDCYYDCWTHSLRQQVIKMVFVAKDFIVWGLYILQTTCLYVFFLCAFHPLSKSPSVPHERMCFGSVSPFSVRSIKAVLL